MRSDKATPDSRNERNAAMTKMIFVNLPVADLDKSKAFYAALGFTNEPKFTDETAACMVWSDAIYVMLLTDKYFQTFTPNPVADSTKSTAAIICLECDSKADVDAIVQKAVKAGGKTYNEPKDHGFMYQHGFMDPDGHIWEYIAMASAG